MRTLFAVGATLDATAVAVIATAAVVISLAPASLRAQDGLYTPAQAERGVALYEAQCVSCHGDLTTFVPEVAALLGDHTFRNRWRGRALGELFELISVEMPQDAPGSLSPDESADLVAYILSGNRLGAGDTALPNNPEQLTQRLFGP